MKRVLVYMLLTVLFSSCLHDENTMLKPFYENGKWGFSNQVDNIVLPAVYDDVLPFSENMAAVKLGDKWGYIDKKGEKVIPPAYDRAGSFCEKIAVVCLGGKCGFVNQKGEEIVSPGEYDITGNFSEGMAVVCIGNQYGFVDKNGEKTIELKYDYAWNFSDGLARVLLGERYGYINKKGEEIVPVIYDFISAFNNDIALARLNNQWRFIDKSGIEKTLREFEMVWPIDKSGFYKAGKNGKYGFINDKGEEVIALKYDDVKDFCAGASIVKLHNKYGLIDRSGREIVPAFFDSIFTAEQQLFVLMQNGEEIHVVNPMGNANIKNIDLDGLKARYAPKKEEETEGIIIDERDGQQYGWIKIGSLNWSTSNLAFESTGSKCFEEDNWIDCNSYGRYYTWETAKNACPEGWKLPSLDEWNMLMTGLGGGKAAYNALTINSPQSLHLKTGGYFYDQSSFVNTGEYGYFWTSTPDGAGAAICIWLNPVEESVMEFSSKTSHYRNVRCVRE